jgi:hypothetical protein
VPLDSTLWESTQYDSFLDERRSLIVQKMNDFIFGK